MTISKTLGTYSMHDDNDLYPFLATLRGEEGLIWSARHKSWLVAHHSVVREALGHSDLSVEKMSPFIATLAGDTRAKLDRINEVLQHWVVFNDPPDHTRIRRALQQVLMPKDLRAFENDVQRVVDEMFDALEGTEEFDFIEDFALGLPARLVCQLFGVPLDDADQMSRWGHGISRFVMGGGDDSRYDDTLADLDQMRTYFEDLLVSYQSSEDDSTLLRRLVAGNDEGEGLTHDEIVATLVLILFAGLDTTANALGNLVLALSQRPDVVDRVRDTPDLAPALVEEVLRYDSPAPMVTRVAKVDVELGGVTVRAGDRLILLLASANRDADVFDMSDAVDANRKSNPHLAFGRGIHFCMGAPLARMELRIVLLRLIGHLPNWTVREDGVRWRDELLVRGMTSLPIVVKKGDHNDHS